MSKKLDGNDDKQDGNDDKLDGNDEELDDDDEELDDEELDDEDDEEELEELLELFFFVLLSKFGSCSRCSCVSLPTFRFDFGFGVELTGRSWSVSTMRSSSTNPAFVGFATLFGVDFSSFFVSHHNPARIAKKINKPATSSTM